MVESSRSGMGGGFAFFVFGAPRLGWMRYLDCQEQAPRRVMENDPDSSSPLLPRFTVVGG